MRFAIFGNPSAAKFCGHEQQFFNLLRSLGDEIVVDSLYYEFLTHKMGLNIPFDTLFEGNDFTADAVISIGGDGTFLRTATRVGDGQNFPIIYYGDVIGNVGLYNAADGKAQIIIWLAPDFWGKGIASRACNWIAEYAANQLSIKILTAKIKSGNAAAIAIAEKLGISYSIV